MNGMAAKYNVNRTTPISSISCTAQWQNTSFDEATEHALVVHVQWRTGLKISTGKRFIKGPGLSFVRNH